jgi:acyl dehydratase
MATNAEQAYEQMQAAAGQDEGAGQWFEVTQDLINQFADVTKDHQFIHVDPEAAKATPFGTTIAHGFLTLSMLTHLVGSIPRTNTEFFKGVVMGVNYGFDKVRFVSPVKVGSKIRATSTVGEATLKDPNTVQMKRNVTIEIEGESRPACVAEWLTLFVYG